MVEYVYVICYRRRNMAGWNLKEGILKKENATEEELWERINFIFSNKSLNRTSYKFAFFKVLLEGVFEIDENLSIDLRQLFSKFSNVYWSLIAKYKLKQSHNGNRSKVETIIEKFINDYNLIEEMEYEKIPIPIKEKLEKEIYTEGVKYVVGALYEDSRGLFYSFKKASGKLTYSKSFKDFAIRHNLALLKIDYFEWIIFLEKVNEDENCLSLANKLESSAKRVDLSLYREILFYKYQQKNCFYCNKSLIENLSEVDHFIPWSFIKNDKLWNLVLTCKKCNRSKRDRLADGEYLNRIIERNRKIKNITIEKIQQDFDSYNEERYIEIYNSAVYNGFELGWESKEIKPKEIDFGNKIKV